MSVKRPAKLRPASHDFEPFDIGREHGLHECCDGRGRRALVLAELTIEVRGEHQADTGQTRPQQGRELQLVRRIAVRIEQADPDRLEFAGDEARHELLDDGALVQGLFDTAVAQHPLRRLEAGPPGSDWLRLAVGHVVGA